MNWLRRLLGGGDRRPPPFIQDALDMADAAQDATDKAQDAVGSYWQARRANIAHAERAMTDAYEDADRLRKRDVT